MVQPDEFFTTLIPQYIPYGHYTAFFRYFCHGFDEQLMAKLPTKQFITQLFSPNLLEDFVRRFSS
jgi:hypothetical protein